MYRFLAAALLVFILLSCTLTGSAEAYAVNYSGGAVVIDENGDVLIPSGSYDALYVLKNDTGAVSGYAAGILDSGIMHFAFLSPDGSEKTGFIYTGIWEAGDGCIVCEDGVYRYLSGSGVYNNYDFTELKYLGGGRLLAITGNKYDDIGDRMTILWPDGISFNTGLSTLNGFNEYSEGLMPLYDDKTLRYGYMNTEGSWKIDPAYLYAGNFKNGLAIIGTENGYGVIDSEGKIRLSASSLQLARTDSIFAAIRGDTLRIYDADLIQTCTMPLNGASVNLTGEYIILSGSDSEHVYDAYGEMLFTLFPGTQISSAPDNTFITRDGPWGSKSVVLRNRNGRILSKNCTSIYSLDGSRLAYSLPSDDGVMHYGLMAYDGSFVTAAEYLSMAYISDGLYCADTETGAVIIDAAGTVLNTFKGNDNYSRD